jgi:hypothetical protein
MISVYYLEMADYINKHHVLHVDSIPENHYSIHNKVWGTMAVWSSKCLPDRF